MPYTKQTWANDAAGNTPISAARLNYMESGIESAAAPVTVTGITTADGPFDTAFMPAGYIIVVVKADDLYGAVNAWPATRPGRADQYVHFIGDTDPGVLALDYDRWTRV